MSSAPVFDLDSFLPYRLAVLAERVSQEFATLYRARHGLTRAEWRVLAHLSAAAEPVSVREVFARVEMDKSKVSRAAARLELTGLIEKRADARDRRLVALSLTGKGRAVMAELIPLARGFEAELQRRLGAEAEAFLRGVDRLAEAGNARGAL